MEAEYRFAKTSATSAGRWAAIEADGDAFNLQYRTAGDDRVRDSHAALDMITLPPSDPFWSSFSFPNGWRCRCSYVQVRKSKYPLSDSAEAIRLAEEATTQIDKDGKNRLEIFRFNPGKDKVIFPPHHPYRKVQDAQGVVNHANEFLEDLRKKLRVDKNKEIKAWAQSNIPEEGYSKQLDNLKSGNLKVNRSNLYNISQKIAEPSIKEVSKDVLKLIPNAKFIGETELDVSKSNYQEKLRRGTLKYTYYEIKWNNLRLRVNMEYRKIGEEVFESPYSINFME